MEESGENNKRQRKTVHVSERMEIEILRWKSKGKRVEKSEEKDKKQN